MVFRIYLTVAVVFSIFAAMVNGSITVPAHATAAVDADLLKIDPPTPKQGQIVVVEVALPDGNPLPAITFNKKKYQLFRTASESGGAVYRALIGVPANLTPGGHTLSVGEIEKKIQVKSAGFPIQSIRLPSSKNNFISSPGEEEAVQLAKSTVSSEQMWTGKFQRPSNARTSSAFGLRRRVNGKLLPDYFHSGLDYAGGLGSPVTATQRGRVIIAKNGWRLHGNTVAIDHGQGIVSFYIHLSKILVKPGQIVEAGQQIGKIGATGRASGPHLHFSVYVNGDATNPPELYTRKI
jgi:murein DD-endopeptidase MepM/ murein hydrolase activator NlpD